MSDQTKTSKHYDIYIREGEVGMYWRHSDRGVTISSEGISWSVEGYERNEAFSNISSIQLMSTHVSKQGNVFTCLIRFRTGKPLSLYSTNDWGSPDEERELPYRHAVIDLHERIAKAGLQGIDFRAGMTGGRHAFLTATLVVATLLFAVLPIGIFVFLETSWHVLGIVGAGVGFIWPLWAQWSHNEPRNYFPDDLPYDLIPG